MPGPEGGYIIPKESVCSATPRYADLPWWHRDTFRILGGTLTTLGGTGGAAAALAPQELQMILSAISKL